MSNKTKNLQLFKWDITNTSDLNSEFNIEKSLNENWEKIDKNVENVATKLSLEIDTTNYIMTLKLLNINDVELDSQTIDFPLESVVVDGKYDKETKKIILTLQNKNEIEIPVGDLISGLVSSEEFKLKIETIEKDINNMKSSIYRINVSKIIEQLTEYELPCSYMVGNDSLEIFFNNERLVCEKSEDEEANYREVGEKGQASNKVIFGWDIEVGDILEIKVKGADENA